MVAWRTWVLAAVILAQGNVPGAARAGAGIRGEERGNVGNEKERGVLMKMTILRDVHYSSCLVQHGSVRGAARDGAGIREERGWNFGNEGQQHR